MRTCTTLTLTSLLTLTACDSELLEKVTKTGNNSPEAAETLITEQVLRDHVTYLSSDELKGRGVGTDGDRQARAYLAAELQKVGCLPGGADGGWEQPVPILGIQSEVKRPLTASGPDGKASFQAPTDYTAVAGSPAAGAEWQAAELVFVGYGIDAPEQRWDDYGDADLEGKVLLVMNNDPADDPERFAGKTRLYYGRWSYQFEEAARAADASVASARSALLESDDRVARLEARLARCRAGAVERARREGRRDFNLVGAVEGDGCERSTEDEKTFAKGADEEKRCRAERRDALVRALDATRGRLRELQLRDAGGDAGALSRFRNVSTTPTKNKAPDPTDRFRPSPREVRPGTDR